MTDQNHNDDRDRDGDRDRDDAAGAASHSGTIPTDTRGASGIGSVAGVAGVGAVGTSFGAGANIPEPPGADLDPVTMEDDDDPDAIAHRDDSGEDAIAPDGVGPEVRPPS